MPRRKQRSLALLGAGAAAAAPIAVQAAKTYGPGLLKAIAKRWKENEGPVRRRVRARRAARARRAEEQAVATPNQVTQVESSGMAMTSVPSSAMIPKPVALNNRRGRWMNGVNGPRIRKSEFIGMISGSTTFAHQSFPGWTDGRYRLNPGLEYSFPWLSAIASNFESYKFHGLRFHYIPTTNLNAIGNLYMTPVIDPNQSVPVPSRELLSEFSNVVDTNVKTGATCEFPIGELADPYKWRYVRQIPNESSDDLHTYDIGYILFTRGQNADTTDQGELWVDYDVELFNPRFRSYITRVEGGKVSSGGTVSAANPLGTAPSVDTDAIGISANASSVITVFNPTYLLLTTVGSGTTPAIVVTGGTGSTVTSLAGPITDGSFSIRIWAIDTLVANATVNITATGTITGTTLFFGTAPVASLSLAATKPQSLANQVDELRKQVAMLSMKPEQKFVFIPQT